MRGKSTFVSVLSAACGLFLCAAALIPEQTKAQQVRSTHISTLEKTLRGIASWYGPRFHGRQTANGETFNQHKLTAAHRTLPLGTKVAVTNLKNGKSVKVRINDRGPYVKKRVIDLSYAAARAIDLVKPGIEQVKIEVLSLP